MYRLNDLLLDLVKVPSPTGREQALSKHLFSLLESLKSFTLKQVGLSLCYFGTVRPDRPTLGFFGHLDTVADQQDKPPYIDGDLLYGCGASDMKSGLAVMIHLMGQIEQSKADYNTIFVFYDREEGPYLDNGLAPVLKHLGDELSRIDLAFVLEPTSNEVQMGCMGGLHGVVKFAGKSAHSARPWQGDNALHKAWPLLKRLSEQTRKQVDSGGLVFYEVINATQGQTQNRRNSIPGEFVLNLNYRFAPGKKIEQAKAELVDLVQGEGEVEFIDQCPSAAAIENNPVFDQFIAQVKLPIESKQAWTDIARLAEHGIDGVNLGPGQPEQAHQANESVLLSQMRDSIKYFSSFLFKDK